ncbi:MAG: bifunctional riboflavin kinase/FAD synthetase [Hyphomicrobium sp.]
MSASLAIIDGLGSVPAFARGASLAIGNFDGVHRGHQALIALAIEEARASGRSAGVMIFEPHPREFFKPDEPHFRLTTRTQKLAIFERLGLDFAIVLRFDAEFAALSAAEFIDRILVGALAIGHAVIGYDFFFGKNRGGTPDMLWQAGEKHGFTVSVIAPVAEDGEVFSSSAIRLHLAQGDVDGAARALGRWWRIEGRVVPGARRGRDIGFPTANIPMAKGTALAHGIYAVRATVDGKTHDGAAYLGTRPTFDDGMPVLEVFLFDFAEDIYGREIAVEFIAFIRGDRKFDGVDALKARMAEDCAKAKTLLAATPRAYA